MKSIYLIGYSGHAFVVADSARNSGLLLEGYFETAEKELNPFGLTYLGSERDFDIRKLGKSGKFFVGIGDNATRKKIVDFFESRDVWGNIVDKSAEISSDVRIDLGVYIGKKAVINPLSEIGRGVIINTGAIVEHECSVGEFAHIAPGSVLCGNVSVGKGTLIGARSVVLPGIKVGSNVIVGAGSVVNCDVPDNSKVYGNPARINANIK